MFRRLWSSLPQDASFPHDLKGLGYFVNDEDEIRSIENPDCYFKFFINRNERINHRQRMEFHRAIEHVVHERLEAEGMQKVTIPLDTPLADPHIPIFITSNLSSKRRVVVVFGGSTQDLGVIAGRVVNGPGGVSQGSMVFLVQALSAQVLSEEDQSTPGIVIANTGQTYWWPEGDRPLTITSSGEIPLSSLASAGRRMIPQLNQVRGNESSEKHVEHMLGTALPILLNKEAKLEIIAVGDSCDAVQQYFDIKENWDIWKGRLSGMVLAGTVYDTTDLVNNELKEFLAKRTCGYVISDTPLNTPLSTPLGNPKERFPPLGGPIFSSGELYYPEMILITAQAAILTYLRILATDPDFTNPDIIPWIRPEPDDEALDDIPEEALPVIAVVDEKQMKEEVKQLRRWERFGKTGAVPKYDSDSEDEHETAFQKSKEKEKMDEKTGDGVNPPEMA